MTNKYDQALAKTDLLTDVTRVQELIRQKELTRKEWWMDLIFGISPAIIDDIKIDGTYYLLSYNDHITLLHINASLQTTTFDVTDTVNHAKHPNKFIYNGFAYKVTRQIDLTRLA